MGEGSLTGHIAKGYTKVTKQMTSDRSQSKTSQELKW